MESKHSCTMYVTYSGTDNRVILQQSGTGDSLLVTAELRVSLFGADVQPGDDYRLTLVKVSG